MSNSNQNPFPLIKQGLIDAFYLHDAGPGSSYALQLHVLSGLVGLSILANIVSLVARWWTGQLWFVRLSTTKHGSFLVPNSVVAWICCSLTFSMLLEFYIQSARDVGVIGRDLYNSALWRSNIWFPLWFGAFVLAWSTALQPIILPTRVISTGFDLARYPRAINTVALLYPLCYLTGTQTLGALANRDFNHIFTNFKILVVELDLATAAVNAGMAPLNAGYIKELLAAITVDQGKFVATWTILWIFSAAFVLMEGSLFAWASMVYFRLLATSIAVLQTQKDSQAARSSRSLRAAHRSLLLTCISTLMIQACYFASNVFLAINTANVTKGGALTEAVTLVAIYIFGVFGTAVNAFILARSFLTSSGPAVPSTGGGVSTLPMAIVSLSGSGGRSDSSSREGGLLGNVGVQLEVATAYYRSEYDDVKLKSAGGPIPPFVAV